MFTVENTSTYSVEADRKSLWELWTAQYRSRLWGQTRQRICVTSLWSLTLPPQSTNDFTGRQEPLESKRRRITKARTQAWPVIKDCITSNVSTICFGFQPLDKWKIIKIQPIKALKKYLSIKSLMTDLRSVWPLESSDSVKMSAIMVMIFSLFK